MLKRKKDDKRALLTAYGAGRAVFGAAAIAAPVPMAGMLGGDAAREVPASTFMANFGTRDVLLGGGMLHALSARNPPEPWLVAGIGADVLDVVVQLRDYGKLPPGKRAFGVGFAAVAAATGIGLFALLYD